MLADNTEQGYGLPPLSGGPLKLEFGAVRVDGPAEAIGERRPV